MASSSHVGTFQRCISAVALTDDFAGHGGGTAVLRRVRAIAFSGSLCPHQRHIERSGERRADWPVRWTSGEELSAGPPISAPWYPRVVNASVEAIAIMSILYFSTTVLAALVTALEYAERMRST